MEAPDAWLCAEAADSLLSVCWLNSDCSSVRGLRPRSSVMLISAMLRSSGLVVVEIDISLKAEFIVSSKIVLECTDSMVASSMPFGAALFISMVGMFVLPVVEAWDDWMLMVSGISGSALLLSFGVSSRIIQSQSLLPIDWSESRVLMGCRMARPVVAIVAAFALTNAEIFRCSFVVMVGMSKWLNML